MNKKTCDKLKIFFKTEVKILLSYWSYYGMTFWWIRILWNSECGLYWIWGFPFLWVNREEEWRGDKLLEVLSPKGFLLWWRVPPYGKTTFASIHQFLVYFVLFGISWNFILTFSNQFFFTCLNCKYFIFIPIYCLLHGLGVYIFKKLLFFVFSYILSKVMYNILCFKFLVYRYSCFKHFTFLGNANIPPRKVWWQHYPPYGITLYSQDYDISAQTVKKTLYKTLIWPILIPH